MPTCWVEANGVQLRYERRGASGGTIVLLHEMGGALESWDDVVPLLEAYATVLRYDQRGAGLSEKPRGPLSVGDAADDLAGLLDALGIADPVAVVGAAVGAAVAVAFVAAYPERVQALILLAPATVLEGERRLAAERRIEMIERLGVRKAFADTSRATRSRYAEIRLAADPAAFAATWRMLIGLRMDAMFAAIRCPALLVAGCRDTARPPDHVAAIAARILDARFLALETGHVMAIEAPRLVATTILDFLADCRFNKVRPSQEKTALG